jgi:hypothetical protein
VDLSGRASPTKKWPGILAVATFLLMLILSVSYVLVYRVSLSRLFQSFVSDGMNKEWYNDKWHLGTGYLFLFEFLDLSGKALRTFSWTVAYISNRGQFFLIFYTTIIFEKILELYYLETLKKNRLKIVIIYYQKQHRYSLRTVGDSLKEQRLPFYISVFFYFFCVMNIYIHLLSVMLSV